MNNRLKMYAVAVALATIVTAALVVAAPMIFSNPVTVNVVGFRVTLTGNTTAPNQYDVVSFTAQLEFNDGSGFNPIGEGETIQFYQNGTPLGTSTTNGFGQATYNVNMTTVGSLVFTASYQPT